MKKIFLSLCVVLCACPPGSAATIVTSSGQTYEGEIVNRDSSTISVLVEIDVADVVSVSNDTAFPCPVKKVPAKEGNFEVIQGSAIPAPIAVSDLRRSFYKALARHGYTVLSDEPGVITYMLKKDDFDCTVRFCYCPHEYWYEYVDSTNLDANPAKDKIHRSYRRWIGILEEDVSELYW